MTDAGCKRWTRIAFYACVAWMALGDPWGITDAYRMNFWGTEPSGLFDADGNEVMRPSGSGGAPVSLLSTVLVLFWIVVGRTEVKPSVKHVWGQSLVQALRLGRELLQASYPKASIVVVKPGGKPRPPQESCALK